MFNILPVKKAAAACIILGLTTTSALAQWANVAGAVAGAMIREAARQQQAEEYARQQRQVYHSYSARPQIRYVTKYRERPQVAAHHHEVSHPAPTRHHISTHNDVAASNPGIQKSSNGGNIGSSSGNTSNNIRHANF